MADETGVIRLQNIHEIDCNYAGWEEDDISNASKQILLTPSYYVFKHYCLFNTFSRLVSIAHEKCKCVLSSVVYIVLSETRIQAWQTQCNSHF